MALDFFLNILFEKATVVVLSTCIGVGGWGWFISSNATIIGTASFEFSLVLLPTSTSGADAITFFNILLVHVQLY